MALCSLSHRQPCRNIRRIISVLLRRLLCLNMTPTCWFRTHILPKKCADFFAHGAAMMVRGSSSVYVCLFLAGWWGGVVEGVRGGVGRGGLQWWMKPPARPTEIGSVSPYCPVVAKWADSSVYPCPMAGTTLMRVERGTFLPCKIPKTIIIPAREPTVLCNSLRRWEMTEPISAHTRPWELGAA